MIHFDSIENFNFPARSVIISDLNVAALWGDTLSYPLFSFPAGDRFKTRKTKEKLEDLLLSARYGRDTTLVALGGGVVTDLVGFLASTYCRGVPFILIPTTLLAMVDACIGGKTGVNTEHGKNMIGVFSEPEAILIDPNFLSTLPEIEMRNGYAEMIKHACIADASYFQCLHVKQEPDIRKNIEIKQSIVTQDRNEKGIRSILNFGHTIGHAIEKIFNFSISHGEAVAYGMIVESRLSYLEGHLSEKECTQIISLILSYFPNITFSLDFDLVLKAMEMDKKALGNIPRFVMLSKIGSALGCKQAKSRNVYDALSFAEKYTRSPDRSESFAC
ncbi:MAG: 3-dehydroquinate synthase [Waddliaceae bacterium]